MDTSKRNTEKVFRSKKLYCDKCGNYIGRLSEGKNTFSILAVKETKLRFIDMGHDEVSGYLNCPFCDGGTTIKKGC